LGLLEKLRVTEITITIMMVIGKSLRLLLEFEGSQETATCPLILLL
jgi:hypothetical protein